MSKPFRDSSEWVGLDVVVNLPADVCERIKQAAKARGETVSGWCRAELIAAVEVACAGEVPPEELAFDVRQALLQAPATKRLDDLAVRTLAERIANHLAQARLRFTRKAPRPLHSTGSVGAELLRRASRRTRTGKQVCPGRREALRV